MASNTFVCCETILFMILSSTLVKTIASQQARLDQKSAGYERKVLSGLRVPENYALIIAGIRRCGKSTLLHQMIGKSKGNYLFLNFEDPRLYEFEQGDFLKLDPIIQEKKVEILFLDEIQIVSNWERYVRQKLEEGLKVVITGSNASLLSKELGTKLTGRHISRELFPFSYHEFCEFMNLESTAATVQSYLELGGFPGYLKEKDPGILRQLFEDILLRDVAIRYQIKDVKPLQRLALFLISNVGTRVTGNKLSNTFGIKSTSTVIEYFSHLENSWLFLFIPRFSYSYKKQSVNPRKVYAIDTGLVNATSASFSKDQGRLFENLVLLQERRRYSEIYYFAEKGECDFILVTEDGTKKALQVTLELTIDNMDREINGLLEAMVFLDLEQGMIVTMDQSDTFEKNGKRIDVLSAAEYFGLGIN